MDIKEMLNKHNELMENEIEALSTKLEILENEYQDLRIDFEDVESDYEELRYAYKALKDEKAYERIEKEKDNNTYVGDTNDLYVMNGELHISYGDEKTLTMCAEQLFKDLPFIINQVCKEQKKMNKMYLKMIKKALK
tara:strand:+ start:86 stop:496 length:411 start_codon:yes stop_codon:yes gene_type:complete